MSTTYTAISLHQPYASLIACGAKHYETRGWAPPPGLIGQRIAIHAAKHRPTLEELVPFRGDPHSFFRRGGWQDRMHFGAVVCTAVLLDALQVTRFMPTDMEGLERVPVLSNGTALYDARYGDYAQGRWIWMLGSVKQILPPAPERGRQRFWRWTQV